MKSSLSTDDEGQIPSPRGKNGLRDVRERYKLLYFGA
jgi:hypothetical protein